MCESPEGKYWRLEGMGAYSPLLIAPVEGLGGPLGPLPSGGNLFLGRKSGKSIDI